MSCCFRACCARATSARGWWPPRASSSSPSWISCPESDLIGEGSRAGLFTDLSDVTVRLIHRGERAILPPFEGVVLEAGDVLIVAATRKVLTAILAKYPGHLLRSSADAGEQEIADAQASDLVLAEAMIKPASRMIGQTLELTNFPERSRCTVLGIERRARMLRTRLHELRLEPGDVLLLVGRQAAIERLRADPDVLPMEWSASDMPLVGKAPLAAWIVAGIVVPAALGLLPIVVTAMLGVIALIATGCLNIRQAGRAVDRQIVLVIAAALGLGTALEATGGAAYAAGLVLNATAGRAGGRGAVRPVPARGPADQHSHQQRCRGAVHAGRGQHRGRSGR